MTVSACSRRACHDTCARNHRDRLFGNKLFAE